MPESTISPPEQVPEVFARQVAAYRSTRAHAERAVRPLATSLDGRSFECQASLHGLELRRGGYVILDDGAHRHLAQVTDLWVDSQAAGGTVAGEIGGSVVVRFARGRGTVMDTAAVPFHDASVRPATPEEVASWFADHARADRAALTIGELLLASGVPASLDSGGLSRHTFMCGQSGSGKTYSLGVLLERVLAETDLRIVILDPNSDYIGLGQMREDADAALAARYARATGEVAVWRNDPAGDHPLRLRFTDLDRAAQAALLGLDPIRDRDEYAVLTDLLRLQKDGRPLITHAGQLLEAETPGARQLGLRAKNLGLLEWALWSPVLPSLADELRHPTARCTVVDLGSLDSVQEQRVVAQTVLSTLWENRFARQPCLVVVDEAHNVCPASPEDPMTALSTDRTVQVAAEGRKYGLYLLVSTQQPHKVHQNVVSQCDNLLLMRMNSEADIRDLTQLFSFVPGGLLAGATSFGLGEALVAGRLVPQATYVRMGRRVSTEGGADIPTTWATPRADR